MGGFTPSESVKELHTSDQLRLNPYLYRCEMLCIIFRVPIQPGENVMYTAIITAHVETT